MKKLSRKKIITISVIAIGFLLIPCLYFYATKFVIGQHQKSAISLLKEWETEYKNISTNKEAFDAIDIYEYASQYYIVGESYSSFKKMNAELELQRKKTLDSIILSLEAFTGLQYAHDLEKWIEWKNNKGE